MMEEIIQGSARVEIGAGCGRITASRIADVLAKTKTGESASRANYAAQLVAERLTGTVAETFVSKEMERGITVEPLARTSYEILRGVDVDQVAFIQHPTIERSGASPDGLVGLDGLIECKAPNTSTHIGYAVTRVIPTKYQLQMLWQISVTGREWCDFVSYDDRLPQDMSTLIIRLDRDDKRIAEIEAEVLRLDEEVEETIAKLKAVKWI